MDQLAADERDVDELHADTLSAVPASGGYGLAAKLRDY